MPQQRRIYCLPKAQKRRLHYHGNKNESEQVAVDIHRVRSVPNTFVCRFHNAGAGFPFINSRPKSGRVAPVILEGAPLLFRLRLEAESRDFPTKEMINTDAWAQLQGAVASGAEQLEFMESRDRRRRGVEGWALAAAAIGLLVFALLRQQEMRRIHCPPKV